MELGRPSLRLLIQSSTVTTTMNINTISKVFLSMWCVKWKEYGSFGTVPEARQAGAGAAKVDQSKAKRDLDATTKKKSITTFATPSPPLTYPPISLLLSYIAFLGGGESERPLFYSLIIAPFRALLERALTYLSSSTLLLFSPFIFHPFVSLTLVDTHQLHQHLHSLRVLQSLLHRQATQHIIFPLHTLPRPITRVPTYTTPRIAETETC